VIHLPRQARDKHRAELIKKQCCFCRGRGNGWAIAALVSAIEYGHADPHRAEYISIFKQLAKKLASLQSSETPLFAPFMYKNDDFTKTCSGQT
jgi:rhamnogalacturonyl hydrolase YesR